MTPGRSGRITRRRAAALLSAGAALAASASARAQPSAPTSGAPAATPDPAVVPAGSVANRMTVPVLIDGQGPFPFVVDSGSDHTTVSSSLATRLGLPLVGQAIVDTATGKVPAPTVRIDELRVGVRRLGGIRAPIFLEDNIGAAGLLGIDALDGQDIVMDFRAGQMTIRESSRQAQAGDVVVTAKSRYGQLILVDAAYQGRDLYVVIDTGAEGSIANSRLRAMVAEARLAAISASGKVVSVSGDTAPLEFEVLPEVRLGGIFIRNLPVGYADVYAFRKLGLDRDPAMLLGMDILRHFDRVSVDFKAKRVRFLLPRAAA